MNTQPIGDPFSDELDEPTGSEIELVEMIRAHRSAKTASDAFYERLMAMKFVPKGLTLMVEDHRAKLRADAGLKPKKTKGAG